MKVRHYTYHVVGDSAFPLDMLRYDTCWPASQLAVDTVGDTFDPLDRVTMRKKGHKYRVEIASHREPTVGRWKSFLWAVEDLEVRS